MDFVPFVICPCFTIQSNQRRKMFGCFIKQYIIFDTVQLLHVIIACNFFS
ncbi:hypothetical protein GLYMA_16G070500v4 [Glycine max]|uniref:Uncharacterized protein n=1 Tax=Glycine max TaxID=3847 RepID=I1MLU0_SOYBN|nr:hypothetical protein GYH30_044377 [Glycine max]KRH07147.1 hypothetical protein GLYMA_16G070500v4 [Glycine max]